MMFFISTCILLAAFTGCPRTRATTTAEHEFDPAELISPDLELSTETVTRKWISEIFDEVQDAFRMHAKVSKQCKLDYAMYETYLRNQTIWAVRMMESSEWPRRGLFAGMTTTLGGWSECLGVRSPTYQGQYCLVDAVFDFSFARADTVQVGWDRHPNQNSSVWGVIKMYDKVVRRITRRKLTWAMCIPSSCTPNDLRTSVMSVALPVFRKYDLDFEAFVTPTNCRVEETKPVSKGFQYTLSFVLLLSTFILLATYWDYRAHVLPKKGPTKTKKESYTMRAFYAFSLLETWKCLKNTSTETISSLYFAKSLLALFIVIAHEGFIAIPFPKVEQEDTELIYRPWEIFLGFHACVDIFVGISGFLTFHFGYEPTKKLGMIYFVGSIVFRWIRLIPVVGLFALVYVFIVPELGDGPLWNRRMLYDVGVCRSNWWTNMLCIQNIVNRKDMCLPHLWYIAVDFQLTIIGSAILVIMAKNFKLGIFSMIITFLTGVGVHFFTIYSNAFTGLPVASIPEPEIMRKDPVFANLYIQVYSRIGPYMVGFTGAVILRALKKRNYHPSTMTSWSIVLGGIFLGAGSMMYGLYFLMIGRPYEVFENALYGPATRTLIAVPVISIVALHGLRRFGWFSYVVGWKIFMVVGRLVYCVYITSFSIQFFRVSTLRQVLVSSNHVDVAYGIMIDACITGISSLLLFALAEGPIHNLTILLLTDLNEGDFASRVAEFKHDVIFDHPGYLSSQRYGCRLEDMRNKKFNNRRHKRSNSAAPSEEATIDQMEVLCCEQNYKNGGDNERRMKKFENLMQRPESVSRV